MNTPNETTARLLDELEALFGDPWHTHTADGYAFPLLPGWAAVVSTTTITVVRSWNAHTPDTWDAFVAEVQLAEGKLLWARAAVQRALVLAGNAGETLQLGWAAEAKPESSHDLLTTLIEQF